MLSGASLARKNALEYGTCRRNGASFAEFFWEKDGDFFVYGNIGGADNTDGACIRIFVQCDIESECVGLFGHYA